MVAYFTYYHYYLIPESFSHQCQLMVFHWSLSDSKSPQVFRTRLRILAVLSNAVVWIVSIRPPTSKSSGPFNNPLVIVPNAPITIGTIVTFMFYSFFNSLARSRYLSFFSLSFRFILWSAGTAKSTILQILFLLLIVMRSGPLAGMRWSVCMSHRSLCVSFSRTGDGLCIYHLFVWSMVFHWSLSDSQSPQVSRTLLSILAVLNNAVIWMVSTRPPTSKSSSPFNNLLVTVPKAPITIGIIVTFMFHNFFNSLARSRYLSFFSHSDSFILWSAGTVKSTILQMLFFVDYYYVWSSDGD